MRGRSMVALIVLSGVISNLATPENPVCSSNTSTETSPHRSDCSSFYKCSNGIPVVGRCPNGLRFNRELHTCDLASKVNCNKYMDTVEITSSQETSSEELSSSSTTTTTSTTTAGTITTLKPKTCPETDTIGQTVMLPHKSECDKYYVCSNGVPILYECPDDMDFNAALNKCDWPFNANCQIIESHESSEEISSTTTTTTQPSTASTITTTQRPTTCPETDPINYSILLVHETDCDKFYKCCSGTPTLYVCPEGLHFNAALNVCDSPENAKCTLTGPVGTTVSGETATTEEMTSTLTTTTTKPIPTTGSVQTTTSAGTTSSVEVSSTFTTTTTTQKPTTCPETDPLDHTVMFPHETDCDKFYKCSNGVPILYDCPDGLHFNPVLNVCDWPDNVNCTHTNSGETTDPSTETSALAETTETLSSTTVSTPITTASPPTTDSGHEVITCPKWNYPCVEVRLPHENNCGLYYGCFDGQKILLQCRLDWHFSPLMGICVPPQYACCHYDPSTTMAPPTDIDA